MSKAPIRSKFTDTEIREAVDKHGYKMGAHVLSVARGVHVSRQLVRHWYRDITGAVSGKPECGGDPAECSSDLCWCGEARPQDDLLHSAAKSAAAVKAPARTGPRQLRTWRGWWRH